MIINLFGLLLPPKIPGQKFTGNDMVFMLCSEECGHELKEILQADIDFINNEKLLVADEDTYRGNGAGERI